MDVTSGNVAFAFVLTLVAGLSTGIGSTIAFFARHTNTRFLAVSLGFSAGIMIYVSFVEILTVARHSLVEAFGGKPGAVATAVAFFAGMLLMALIDRLVPSFENPHEMRGVEEMAFPPGTMGKEQGLLRMGLFTALAIGIHNFPEGLVTFASALTNPALGISITIAIAFHNIPEGIAVSVPIYYATRSRGRAFTYSFLSGLAEPVGALIGFAALRTVLNGAVTGCMMAGVAGIMVFISLDELLPSAQKYGEHHLSIYGLIVGMAVMAGSLLLF